MNAQQINFTALANTARECAGIANSVSGTMAWIVQHWNLCCQQAGLLNFTTEARYTRRAQLAADMERMAAQLDNLANNCDALTGEKTFEQEVQEVAAQEQFNEWANTHDSRKSEAEWIEIDHAEALEMNAADDAAAFIREAVRVANRDHGIWITAEQVAAVLADGVARTAEQAAREAVNEVKAATRRQEYADQLATVAALDAAVDASTDGTEDTPEFLEYERTEQVLEQKAIALLQACGHYSVEMARYAGKPISDIEALKTMFAPYYSGNFANVHPGQRNKLISLAMKPVFNATSATQAR